MSWKDVVFLCAMIIGVILFLYGGNFYDAVIGWIGFFLIIGGFFMEIVLKVYETLRRKVE